MFRSCDRELPERCDGVFVLLRYAFRLDVAAALSGVTLRIPGAALLVATPLLVGAVVGRLPEVAAQDVDVAFVVLLLFCWRLCR